MTDNSFFDSYLKEVEKYPPEELRRASQALTSSYQEKSKSFFDHRLKRLAYLGARMPATQEVCKAVLSGVAGKAVLHGVNSLLDLGSGPGTAYYAAKECFPSVTKATLVERDREIATLGKELFGEWCETDRIVGDVGDVEVLPHDMVILSYVINELSEEGRKRVVLHAWKHTKKFLIIIEPGTPSGFKRIVEARSLLIAEGGSLVAPCPHEKACPIRGENWCHFYARVSRSPLHRFLKEGALGHEDEKFSYVVFSKVVAERASSRVVRHPKKRKGVVEVELCTDKGIEKREVSKGQKEQYKKARKVKWGDPF